MDGNNATKGIGFLALLSIFTFRACRSCDSLIDDELRKLPPRLEIPSKPVDDLKKTELESPSEIQPIPHSKIEEIVITEKIESDNDANISGFKQNSDNSYSYNGNKYYNFNEIPFQSTDNIYLNRVLTSEEAEHLIVRGVKFVYNNPAYLKQKAKSFKVILLISDDVEMVKILYGLDDHYAKELISNSSDLIANESIIKVSSFNEMIKIQNQLISKNEVPVLIFHNSVDKSTLNRFNRESNFITCNSFEITTESYLTSIDLLDMKAIIHGLNESYSSNNLEEFYTKFTSSYHSHMAEYHQHNSLIYLGGGIGVGGGVYAIAYYNKEK